MIYHFIQDLEFYNIVFHISKIWKWWDFKLNLFQCGVPEAVMESVRACPTEATPHLLANIVVVGGCALFDGMESRLLSEIRALAPDDMDVNVTVPKK